MLKTRFAGRLPVNLPREPLSGRAGFTLLELLVALSISTMIIVMISGVLSFCIRLWHSHEDQHKSDLPAYLELLNTQLGLIYSGEFSLEEDEKYRLLGYPRAVVFATSYSVKSISSGVPVLACYLFDPREQKLAYREWVYHPYDKEYEKEIRSFLKGPDWDVDEQNKRFFEIPVEEFSAEYDGGEEEGIDDQWDKPEEVPRAMLVHFKAEKGDKPSVRRMGIGFLTLEDGEQQ